MAKPMGPDEIFDLFPQLLIESFRKQLLLGMVPARTVRAVLGPLLEGYWEIMPHLTAELRDFVQDVLRIYPDVAVLFSLKVKPPLVAALPGLAERLRKVKRKGDAGFGPGKGACRDPDSRLGIADLAAEGQIRLPGALTEPQKLEGQGFFETDRGSVVFLEFGYNEGKDKIMFARRPIRQGIDVYLRDRLLLSFRAGEHETMILGGRLLAAFEQETLSVELIAVKERL